MTTTFFELPEAERPAPPVLSLVLQLLAANWSWGRLTVVLPDGACRQIVGPQPGHAAVIRILDQGFAWRVLLNGDIGFAEGYMAGQWDTPDLPVLLETLVNNYDHIRKLFDGNPVMNWVNAISHRLNRNSRRGSRRNIHAHYDLGNAFYALWLDETMSYSSGFFGNGAHLLRAITSHVQNRPHMQSTHRSMGIPSAFAAMLLKYLRQGIGVLSQVL
jgi:cyclopropane-fatty-acyl-phospholipid synthase